MTNLTEFKPFVIKDVLSQEDYDYVYECVNEGFPTEITPDLPPDNREFREYLDVPELGYLAYIKGFKQGFCETVKEISEKATGLSLRLPQIHFARYTTKTGNKPLLRPHNDSELKNPSITLSIQLDSTLDWELCAYDTCDTLESNQALIFSGSHQIHWRPVVEFSDEDYFDILVCQLSVIGESSLSEDHSAMMEEIKKIELKKFFEKYPNA
jgi:hypothetical protein